MKINKKIALLKGNVLRTGGQRVLSAFTLFELLVVISIIGILIAVASVAYGGSQKKARDSRKIEDLNGIQKAMEMAYSQFGYTYPATQAALVATGTLQVWPKDPKGVGYSGPMASTGYCICTAMDNLNGGNATAANCTSFTNDTNSATYYCVKNQQ